jgi:DNA-binding GntR family transcriptional regulator
METKAKKTMTITNKITETLKQEITYGKIQAGEEIVERKIAERFHASNIPVREALRVLEGEGFIVHRKFSGYSVRRIEPEEMIELYDIVRYLSVQLLSKGIPRYTELTYHHFRTIIDKMDKSKDINNTISLFMEFVETAFTPAGLKYSLELALQILNHNVPVIHGVIEKIYKGKFSSGFMIQFMTFCQQKETEKAITVWMDEYELRTKKYVEIISSNKQIIP